MNETHYLLLWAIRESTGSLARRQVQFSGGKHYGISLAENKFQDELGKDWFVSSQITTEKHFKSTKAKFDSEPDPLPVDSDF